MPTSSLALSLTKALVTSFLRFWCRLFSNTTNIVNFHLQDSRRLCWCHKPRPHPHNSGKVQTYTMTRTVLSLSMHQHLGTFNSFLSFCLTMDLKNCKQLAVGRRVQGVSFKQHQVCICPFVDKWVLTLSCSVPPHKPHLRWLSNEPLLETGKPTGYSHLATGFTSLVGSMLALFGT